MPKINLNHVIIFSIKCTLNDDHFITSTTGDLERAFVRLKNKSKLGANKHILLYTMMKYGANNYFYEVLETLESCKSKNDILAAESKYIKLLNPNLNLNPSNPYNKSIHDDAASNNSLNEECNENIISTTKQEFNFDTKL